MANRWDEKAGFRMGRGVCSQVIEVLKAQIRRRPARKLAVLLHHLWVSGESVEPLHNSIRTTVAAAA